MSIDNLIQNLSYYIFFRQIIRKLGKNNNFNNNLSNDDVINDLSLIRSIFRNGIKLLLECNSVITISFEELSGQKEMNLLIKIILNNIQKTLESNKDKIFSCLEKILCKNNFNFDIEKFITILDY